MSLTFENKQRKAANYDAYKAQLTQIEQSFGTMLRQLPGETEIPSLIVDISQTGLAAGLQEKLFVPQAEIPKDFYAEKPIKIRLTGGYHEIGNFVSGIAALPRIVTLHDINIVPEGQGTFDELWPYVEELLSPVDRRGMEKGDAILYRIDGSSVRIVYVGPDGDIIVDGTYEGAEAARGFVGSFVCRETAFSEDLIRSAWETDGS